MTHLLRKAPDLAAACGWSMIVEIHRVNVSTAAPPKRDGNHLTGFRVIAETCRIGHPDKFVFDERIFHIDLERLGHEFTQFLRVGSIGDYQKLAVDEPIRAL